VAGSFSGIIACRMQICLRYAWAYASIMGLAFASQSERVSSWLHRQASGYNEYKRRQSQQRGCNLKVQAEMVGYPQLIL
jgi:hypothetical protein